MAPAVRRRQKMHIRMLSSTAHVQQLECAFIQAKQSDKCEHQAAHGPSPSVQASPIKDIVIFSPSLQIVHCHQTE